MEWNDLIAAIREDTPYNEVERGVMASAVTSMGRMAAHTGQEITLEQFMSQDHEFAPGIDNLTMDSPVTASGQCGRSLQRADAWDRKETRIPVVPRYSNVNFYLNYRRSVR